MGNDSSYFQYFSVALGAATYLRVRHLKWRRLDATRSFEDLRVLKGLEELLSGVSCKFKEPDPSLIGLVSDLLCMGQESFCRVWTCSRHIRSRFPIQPSSAWFCNSPWFVQPSAVFFALCGSSTVFPGFFPAFRKAQLAFWTIGHAFVQASQAIF